ncbi:MAG TPA: TIGR03790 family protein, partial [Steroidobacteraceae bacterium]
MRLAGLLLACLTLFPDAASAAAKLTEADLAVVINTADPLSVAIGNYYVAKRHISKGNIARVHFDATRDEIPAAEFSLIKAAVEKQVSPQVQAYALTWARPFRAGCMSITSAFAFGFDPSFCATTCRVTRISPYFNATTARPYDDLKIRPAMSIAATDLPQAEMLIDRGIAAGRDGPRGTAFLIVNNADAARSVRKVQYAPAAAIAGNRVGVRILKEDPQGLANVMFYFTGAISVPELHTDRFLPGAIADHLTSFGGLLTDSPQMSSLEWLNAGATGSYGTVVEPCAFLGKFPDVRVVIGHYLLGETLIEAYWKSV